MKKFIEIWNSKALFIPRILLWLGCVAGVPIYLINSQFILFSKNTGGIDFHAWGVVVCLIAAVSIYALLGYIIRAFEYSFVIQLLQGIQKILIWIAFAYLVCTCIEKNIAKIQFILAWSFVSCSVGIIINPFPRWSYKTKYKRIKEELK